MERRTKYILAAVFTALLLLLLALLLLFRQPTQTPSDVIDVIPGGITDPAATLPGATDPGREPGAVTPIGPGTQPTAPVAPPDGSSAVRSFAAAFAERFGSFSNQTDFVNITDLEAVMSPRLQAWARAFVADARTAASAPGATAYAGMTTRSLTTTMEAFDESAGTARVRVGTQRQQSAAGAPSEIYLQDIIIGVVRINGEWRADSADWQPRQ